MSTKTIFIVQGFETRLDEGQIADFVTIEVYAKTEEEAIEKAMKYVKKSHYRISQVIEK